MRELTLGLEVASSHYQLPRTTYQDWSLRIVQTRPEDSGVYVCQINLEQTIEKFFQLQVKQKPVSLTNSRITEHEFVKDEAIQQLPTASKSTVYDFKHFCGVNMNRKHQLEVVAICSL
ncbi:uncharacterized protein DEA37_0010362 [Paragonimus westermani]|uniref:Uncharacterized protein n=1 Tax=Paragonimus westermani TaxID=34504 RepID=A0A5J4N9A6_9TREM|nr:uncharacterized protein DEA37_0010362 [Paragonimus westermani]